MTANGASNDWEDEKIEMEVKIQKSQARINAMQNELTASATMYAKEIAKLKLLLAEKESLIETMSADIYNK
jgi:Skp family chaperone for outer membrane proteins